MGLFRRVKYEPEAAQPGWFWHPGMPAGLVRWWDGKNWTSRMRLEPAVPPPRPIGLPD